MLAFVLVQYDKGGTFQPEGTDIDGRDWALLFISITGIFAIFQAGFNWRSLTGLQAYRSILRTVTPAMVSVPLVYLLIFGPDLTLLLVSAIIIPLLVISFAFNGRMLIRSPLFDMIMLTLSHLLMAAGIFASAGGSSGTGYMEMIPLSVSGFLGTIGVLVFSIRVNVFSSIMARRSMFNIWLLILVLAGIAIMTVTDPVSDASGTMLLWYLYMVSLVAGLAFLIIKRLMDAAILSVYRFHDRLIEDTDQGTEDQHPNYILYRLDNAIRSNPIHGLGDLPANGNLIFRMEGREGSIDIVKEPDEFVKAHWEKGKLLASRGRFKEALKEYENAVQKRGDHYRTYYYMSILRASMPGEFNRANTDLDMYLASRRMYVSRFIENGVMDDYMYILSDLYDRYTAAIRLKMQLLKDLGTRREVTPYFTLSLDH